MITVRIKGGLGNQLFQYAAAYALSKRTKQDMQMDISFFPQQTLRGFKLDKLNISCMKISNQQSKIVQIYKNKYLNKFLRKVNIRQLPCENKGHFLLETRSDIVPEYFKIQQNDIYIDGYYQSERYFVQYREDLIKQFTSRYPFEEAYINVFNLVERCNSVAVHVRRGDFLNAQNDRNPNHYLLGEKYYHLALQYMEKNIDNPHFFWFSDDIEWVKQNFGERENFTFISLQTKYPDIDEMMLMKNCKHIIAANSTFSWWASWLNEHKKSIHICPEKRYGNLHMIPCEWIKIPVE